MFFKEKLEVKKQVYVLATFILVTAPREKVVENAEDGKNLETTAKTSENSENSRANLAQVLYIQYSIGFLEKICISAF